MLSDELESDSTSHSSGGDSSLVNKSVVDRSTELCCYERLLPSIEMMGGSNFGEDSSETRLSSE